MVLVYNLQIHLIHPLILVLIKYQLIWVVFFILFGFQHLKIDKKTAQRDMILHLWLLEEGARKTIEDLERCTDTPFFFFPS